MTLGHACFLLAGTFVDVVKAFFFGRLIAYFRYHHTPQCWAFALHSARGSKAKYSIVVPTWTCPYFGFIHKPADLLKLDGYSLICKKCCNKFESIPTGPS